MVNGVARRLAGAVRHDLAALAGAIQPALSARPGLYTYRVGLPGGSRRIHLRIEADGFGVLLVDVTDAIHLNPTAALVAKAALDRKPLRLAVASLKKRSRGAGSARIEREAGQIYAMVDHLLTVGEGCPTCGLDPLARAAPFSVPVRAPYKADLALTYRCNNACGHCYNQRARRDMPSLDPDDWRRVLDKLAEIGIPHIILTGGEPTLFDHLDELVRHADRLGMIVGLNTNGRRLAAGSMAESLARAGLGHVQVTLESCLPEVHDAMTGARSFHETKRGIEAALAAGLHTITNTTLTRRNVGHAERIVDFLYALGVRTFAANGMIYSGRGQDTPDALAERDMGPVLVRLRDRAAELGMRFLWYTPTAYCRLSPVELEIGPRRCNAAEYSICIEPNGDVLPCQSYYVRAGNILSDPWPAIWNSRLFRGFRDRHADPRGCGLPRECWDCPDLSLCGGGCRIEREKDGECVTFQKPRSGGSV